MIDGTATPKLKTDVFSERRRALADRIGDGVAVLSAAPETLRNGDVHHPYRQDSDLWYLTGFHEPEAVLVVRGGARPASTLFVRPRDRAKETWTGRRAGPEGAKSRFGVDSAFDLSALDAELPKLLEGVPKLHYALGRDAAFDRRILAVMESLRAPRRAAPPGPTEIVELGAVLHEMRLVKAPPEIDALRAAAAVSAEAHRAAMRTVRPGATEYEIAAVVEFVCRRRGSARLGYPAIVGAGVNATILHYVENDGPIRDGDLVLVDAGCEADFYTADITRTFPASGRFTPPQRALYEVVLDAQLRAIDACRAGRRFNEAHDAAVAALIEGMIKVGLLTGEPAKILADQSYTRFYMHRTSHWLGLDVHDVGRYVSGSESRPLAPGHVLTIEPGIYVSEDDEQAPAEFRGIGIRIEDDVLVTSGAPEVLSAAAPKSVADVEALCSTRAPLPDLGAWRNGASAAG